MNGSVTRQSIKQRIGVYSSNINSVVSLHEVGPPLGLLKYLIQILLFMASDNVAVSHQEGKITRKTANKKSVSYRQHAWREKQGEIK